jgi:hypothetical protein
MLEVGLRVTRIGLRRRGLLYTRFRTGAGVCAGDGVSGGVVVGGCCSKRSNS